MSASCCYFSSAVAGEKDATALFELGVNGLNYEQSDDDEEDTLLGFSGAAQLTVPFESGTRAVFELQSEYFANSDNDFDETTPTTSTLFTGRYEMDHESVTAAGFLGMGSTSHDEDDDGVGYVFGISALVDLDAVDIFGTFGHADIRVDEDDSGFTGEFGELGVIFEASSSTALKVSLGAGHADEGYEDDDDSGSYTSFGIKSIYQPEGYETHVTFGYQYVEYEANTEDDARESRLMLGIVVPIGGNGMSKLQALRPISTPLTPFRAASYGEVLD